MFAIRLKRAAVSLIALVIGYWVYAFVALPWIEPTASERNPAVGRDAPPKPTTTGRYRALLEPLFPPGSWELDDAIVLRNNRFTLLLRDYQPSEDGKSVHLKPCTLVFSPNPDVAGSEPREDSADEQDQKTLVLQAPEGAVLEFDQPLDLRQGGLGRLLGGMLIGNVVIQSRNAARNTDDSIYLRTRQIQMDEQRISTPHDVEIRFGPHYGRGRDLTIHLTSTEKGDVRRLPSSMSSRIRSIELVHLEKMRLMVPASVWSKLSKDQAANSPAGDATEPIDIVSQGPLSFDMLSNVARLERDVTISHPTRFGQPDVLRCQLVSLHFAHRLAAPAPTAGPPAKADDATESVPKLEIVHVAASGEPATISAPSWDIQARAQQIEYNFPQRKLLLQDQREAFAQLGKHTIRTRQLECSLGRQQSDMTIDAEGPGQYDGLLDSKTGDEGPQPVKLAWQSNLRLQPIDGAQVISVKGKAKFESTRLGYLSAEELHLWLQPTAPSPPAIARTTTQTDKGHLAQMTQRWHPDRLLAKQNVEFDSPQLGGSTDQLELWFKTGEQPVDEQFELNEPLQNRSASSARAAQRDSASHFTVRGDLIRVLMIRQGTETQLDDVTVRGNVEFLETTSAGPNKLPLEMRGQLFRLQEAAATGGVATIHGSPAIVRARGMELSGTEINLDRAGNRVWIHTPGMAIIPLPDKIAAEFSRRRASAKVTWQGSMEFDGHTVRCQRNIDVSGPAQRIFAQSLQAALTQPINLARPQIDAREVQIAQVQVAGSVWMENRTFDQRGQASIDRMGLERLTIHQQSGQIDGSGPGWVSSVRYGSGPFAAQQEQRGSGSRLVYLQVNFQAGIQGNTQQREISFLDRVRAIYGPVPSWESRLDMDDPNGPGRDNVLMRCQRLTIAQLGDGAISTAPLEMVAIGDTIVEGQTFTAEAHRISYAQAKDLLVVEGDARSAARLSRQERIGGPRTHGAARKIRFWPRTNRVSAEDVLYGDLIGLGG